MFTANYIIFDELFTKQASYTFQRSTLSGQTREKFQQKMNLPGHTAGRRRRRISETVPCIPQTCTDSIRIVGQIYFGFDVLIQYIPREFQLFQYLQKASESVCALFVTRCFFLLLNCRIKLPTEDNSRRHSKAL